MLNISLTQLTQLCFWTISKEDLDHLFYGSSYSHDFWDIFCNWWTNLRGETLSLSLRDVIVGILNRNDLLNYLIILGKLCIWECRRNKSLPKFNIFLQKVEAKQTQTEKLIASKITKKDGNHYYDINLFPVSKLVAFLFVCFCFVFFFLFFLWYCVKKVCGWLI